MPGTPTILTPDQRLRVFVSSTLRELAAEREAAKAAIETLHLTPVLFELGARPHAPRDLYRAYLAQSHVFVGIYAASYGWVAPGEDVSGLEDEYRLAGDLAKLIYVKRVDGPREPRLEALLVRIKDDDRVSYRAFGTAEELRALLTNDLALLLSERFTAHEDDAAADAPPSSLPALVTSFVGREALLRDLDEALARPDVRLLTLHGPGGTGKSRLAIELARRAADRYPDGIAFVSLAQVEGPAGVPSAVAAALGVRETHEVDTATAVLRRLAATRTLLVLDNFEHVLEAGDFVAELLAASPALDVVVTSRSLLRVSGESAYPVPPMELPPDGRRVAAADAARSGAIRLFVERARAADPSFVLTDANADAVVQICRRVDALPLAIELAAARVRTLPPSAILARLTKRLPMLTGGPRDAPARQRTLRDAIAWSHALLTADEQRLFARLALFAGTASLESVERLLGGATDATDTLEAVSSLRDKSLVQRIVDADEVRVVMLETIREFALERLQDDPDAERLRLEHAHHFLEFAERGAPELVGPDQVAWLRRLERDEPNLRLALATLRERGHGARALRLVTALRPYWQKQGRYREGRAELEAALAAAPHAAAVPRAAALRGIGVLAWRQGVLDEARSALERSLELAQGCGERESVVDTLRLLGILSHNRAEFDRARELLEASLALAEELGDEGSVASIMLTLGNVAFDRGDPGAIAFYERSRSIAERTNDMLGVAFAVDNLGVAAWCLGHERDADRLTDRAERLYADLQHRVGLANVAHRRGLLAFGRGQLDAAEAHYRACLVVREEVGEARGTSFVRYDLGRLMVARGRLEDAAAEFARGVELATAHGSPILEVLFVEGAAALASAAGRPREAAVLQAAARSWRERLRSPGCPVNRGRMHALETDVAAAVPGEELERAAVEGAALQPAEAVARAGALFAACAPPDRA